MVTQVIKWKPSSAVNVIQYEIYKSDTGISGTYSLLTTISHIIPGPNYVDVPGGTSYFFYTDIYIPYRYYRIRIRDQYGNVAEDTAPCPFLAGNDPAQVPILQILALNENTGSVDNLRYITEGGTPIEGAAIRVYKKIDYDLRNLNLVVGITHTTAAGRWVDSIFVEPGQTYAVVYTKPNLYGPDKIEITV